MAVYPNISQWQILDENGQVLLLGYDSFGEFSYKGEATVPDEPVEEGSFVNYNKVLRPDDVRVSILYKGGSSELQSAIEILQSLKAEAKLISVLTPIQTCNSVTLTGLSYSRKAEQGIIKFELQLKEIRQVSPEYSTVDLPPAECKNAFDASAADRGKVQAQDPKANKPKYNSLLSRIGA